MPSGSDVLVSINNPPFLFLRVLAVEALASPGRKVSIIPTIGKSARKTRTTS